MSIEPLGVLRTCWPDRWGVPRQSGLVPDAWGTLELSDHVPTEALRGLERATHVWLIAWMHGLRSTRWTVRPPRLGGERLGVLATRSPHRPSRITISAVRLVGVEGRRVLVAGHDLADGTPILDLKPYVGWADALPGAQVRWSIEAPPPVGVCFGPDAEAAVADRPDLRALITQTLAADPRQGVRDWERVSVRVEDVDVHASAVPGGFRVDRVGPCIASGPPIGAGPRGQT